MILSADLRSVRPVLGYGRGSRMMQALVVEFGRDSIATALRDFVDAWRQRHPTPWDFMNSIERSLGTQLTSFWGTWIFSDVPAG